VRKNHEIRMQTAEMKFLNGIIRYMHADYQCNTKIRKILKVFNLNIKIQNAICTKNGRLLNV
jgi:hypothetical protein